MKTSKPAYLALYESLREEILSGIRPEGSRLPSRRSLSRDRGVSEITVDHGIELLCEEGYAEARPRGGYYGAYRSTDGFAGTALSAGILVSETEVLFISLRPCQDIWNEEIKIHLQYN